MGLSFQRERVSRSLGARKNRSALFYAEFIFYDERQVKIECLLRVPKVLVACTLLVFSCRTSRIVSVAGVQSLCNQRVITFIEAQTLALHTMDARNYARAREDFVFFVFNRAIRMGGSGQVRRWSMYTKLFSDALHKASQRFLCRVSRAGPVTLTHVLYVKDSPAVVTA